MRYLSNEFCNHYAKYEVSSPLEDVKASIDTSTKRLVSQQLTYGMISKECAKLLFGGTVPEGWEVR